MHSSESVVPENFNAPPIVDVPSTANICEQSEQINVLSSGNICEDDIENNERDEVPFEWVSGFSKNPRIPGLAIVKENCKYIFNKITGWVLHYCCAQKHKKCKAKCSFLEKDGEGNTFEYELISI